MSFLYTAAYSFDPSGEDSPSDFLLFLTHFGLGLGTDRFRLPTADSRGFLWLLPSVSVAELELDELDNKEAAGCVTWKGCSGTAGWLV